MPRIAVIGGVAGGMTAAARAKRRSPGSEVVVFERGRYVSYSACGMPYNIGTSERSIEELVVMTPERLRAERGIDVRLIHEVVGIDALGHRLSVRDLATGAAADEPYDRLVIATGASPAKPPLPGVDLPGVFFLRSLEDGALIKDHLSRARPRRAVIIGAGYIGLEMADVFRSLGIEVVLLEKLGQIAAGYEPEIVALVEQELDGHAVRVEAAIGIHEIARAPGGLEVRTDRGAFSSELVLVATGVQPNVSLAVAAGVALGPTGAIAVDDHMRTSLPDTFAAGDCAEAHHLVTGAPAYIPLGTTANRQGRIAGANAAGADERFGGIVGTAAFKVFELEVARTGLGAAEVASLGLDAVKVPSAHRGRARGFYGSRVVRTVLFAERTTGKLLGAQMAGDTAAKRIDVFATALHAGMSVEQIERLDLTYAPPIAPVFDPILIAARVASKALGR